MAAGAGQPRRACSGIGSAAIERRALAVLAEVEGWIDFPEEDLETAERGVDRGARSRRSARHARRSPMGFVTARAVERRHHGRARRAGQRRQVVAAQRAGRHGAGAGRAAAGDHAGLARGQRCVGRRRGDDDRHRGDAARPRIRSSGAGSSSVRRGSPAADVVRRRQRWHRPMGRRRALRRSRRGRSQQGGSRRRGARCAATSATTGQGLDELRRRVLAVAGVADREGSEQPFVTTARQQALAAAARDAFAAAAAAWRERRPPEVDRARAADQAPRRSRSCVASRSATACSTRCSPGSASASNARRVSEVAPRAIVRPCLSTTIPAPSSRALEAAHRLRVPRVVDGVQGPTPRRSTGLEVRQPRLERLPVARGRSPPRACRRRGSRRGGHRRRGVAADHRQRIAVHVELEAAVADWLRVGGVRLFNTGYAANVGVLTTLLRRRATSCFSDELNHASIIDGCRLVARRDRGVPASRSRARSRPRSRSGGGRRRIVVSESLFSMDGDIADVVALAALCSPARCGADPRRGARDRRARAPRAGASPPPLASCRPS